VEMNHLRSEFLWKEVSPKAPKNKNQITKKK